MSIFFRLVCEGNPTFESYVEGKSSGREILCTLGVPNLRPQHKTSSAQMCLYKTQGGLKFTAIGDLKGAFLSTKLSKVGLPLPVSLLIWIMGGLLNGAVAHLIKET